MTRRPQNRQSIGARQAQIGHDDAVPTTGSLQRRHCRPAVGGPGHHHAQTGKIGNDHLADALVVVDSVSGLAAEKLETDAWGLDCVVTGSQKGLMNAPGLAFASVSERAWKAVEASKLPKFNFDYKLIKKSLGDKETPWTPAISIVAGQAAALKLLRAEGMENCWKRHDDLAAHARKLLKDKLGLPFYAKNPANILTGVKLPESVDGNKLLADILKEEGISIAGGQLHLKGRIFRLAHMGYITKSDIEAGVAALEKRLAGVKA